MKLELRHITKKFGNFTANEDVNLIIEPGQIHALLGENGAGKSTMMNVVYGLYAPTAGEILIDDQVVEFAGPGQAMAAGIGMVHQHFMLVPVFTVAENVVLGHEPVKGGGLIDLPQARKLVKEISDRFGFDVDPDALIEDLPVGVQQRVEIIKALSRQAKVLILDEPTAVLTPQETDELMSIMRQLKASGTSIVFITHKLREVQEVADTITVIRHGRVVGQADPSASQTELAELMVGHTVNLTVDKEPVTGEPAVALSVEGLSVVETDGRVLLDDLNFAVRRGTILAVAGVQGNGQTELARALIGLLPSTAGSVKLGVSDRGTSDPSATDPDMTDLTHYSVKQRLDYGIGFVPEDRSTDGMIYDFSIAENLILNSYNRAPFGSSLALKMAAIADHAVRQVEEFDVRCGGANERIATLSGGNAQKVVVARELSRKLKLLIASQPTRGVDVGSIEFIHKRIVQERDKGTPVVIISTELDEVLALADEIAVMYRGRIVGVVPPTTSRRALGLMMAGVPADEAQQMAGQSPEEGNH